MHTHHSSPESKARVSAEESVLLMHYLDCVFPLQYPLYKSESLAGRGWLLTLLLGTKPLYHGALALSAYHRRTSISQNLSQARRLAMQIQQEQNLEIGIKMANMAAQNSCPKNGLGIAMAVVQLFFHEVFWP